MIKVPGGKMPGWTPREMPCASEEGGAVSGLRVGLVGATPGTSARADGTSTSCCNVFRAEDGTMLALPSATAVSPLLIIVAKYCAHDFRARASNPQPAYPSLLRMCTRSPFPQPMSTNLGNAVDSYMSSHSCMRM